MSPTGSKRISAARSSPPRAAFRRTPFPAPRPAASAAAWWASKVGGRLMSEPKPFASLSSGLLARKGAAKPAMRPQGFGQIGIGTEDPGWNYMGSAPAPAEPYTEFEHDLPESVPSRHPALNPAPT